MGKSEAAKNMGNQIFNVDLKTSVDMTDISRILEYLAWCNIILKMEEHELLSVHQHILECPAIQRSWALILTKLKT